MTRAKHLRDLMDQRQRADERFDAERDRRITEVGQERERALQIEKEGREKALELAREIQDYKDEKANELRSQIERERGTYVTHTELKPVFEYVAAQQGRSRGLTAGWGFLLGAVGLVLTLLSIVAVTIALFAH